MVFIDKKVCMDESTLKEISLYLEKLKEEKVFLEKQTDKALESYIHAVAPNIDNAHKYFLECRYCLNKVSKTIKCIIIFRKIKNN